MRNIILLILLLITSLSYSQKNGYFVIEPNYSYYKQHELNISLVRSIDVTDNVTDIPVGYIGPFISGGINITDNKNLFVSKTGIVGFFYFIGGRISLINYSDFNTNQFGLRPEIGLTFAGYISITYGYNFKLTKYDKFNIESHTITISLGIAPYLIKEKKHKTLFK